MKKIFFSFALVFLLAASCSQKMESVPNQAVDQPSQITVTQKIAGQAAEKIYKLDPSENKSALELLKSDHRLETKVYEGIGEMVLSIDGVKPDAKHFWAFYLNGLSSNVGASSYSVKNNDIIEWKLEEIKNY